MSSPYDKTLSDAVRYFWQTRNNQGKKQGKLTGNRDQGNRALVTGGAQLNGFIAFFQKLAIEAKLPSASIHIKETTLPGFFRPTKEWDMVIFDSGILVAAIEFKSHIGPSFGNNFNNRVEEALGTAYDINIAYREGKFGGQAKPWLGYFMLLEKHDKSLAPVKPREPFFPVFPEFQAASYKDRYTEFCKRLVKERTYDAACLLLSSKNGGSKGIFEEPSDEVSHRNFIASLLGALTAHAKRIELSR